MKIEVIRAGKGSPVAGISTSTEISPRRGRKPAAGCRLATRTTPILLQNVVNSGLSDRDYPLVAGSCSFQNKQDTPMLDGRTTLAPQVPTTVGLSPRADFKSCLQSACHSVCKGKALLRVRFFVTCFASRILQGLRRSRKLI